MSLFVTLEGIEGSGKSTLQQKLSQALTAKNHDVTSTREPGATPLGARIRSLILDSSLEKISSQAELLLFSADRAEHVEKVLRPALASGSIVICDRYLHSTLAYQGYGRELPLSSLRGPIEFATNGLTPDLVLLLDLEPLEGLKRARMRAEASADKESSEWTRFEEEELAFHTRVRRGFLELAKEEAETFAILDASQTPDEIASRALEYINARLESS